MRPRITDVRLLKLRTLQEIGSLDTAWDLGGRMTITTGGGLVTEIHSNDGIVGIGPGVDPSLLSLIRRILVGADPFDVEQHAAALRYYAFGLPYSGPTGVDVALWDL